MSLSSFSPLLAISSFPYALQPYSSDSNGDLDIGLDLIPLTLSQESYMPLEKQLPRVSSPPRTGFCWGIQAPRGRGEGKKWHFVSGSSYTGGNSSEDSSLCLGFHWFSAIVFTFYISFDSFMMYGHAGCFVARDFILTVLSLCFVLLLLSCIEQISSGEAGKGSALNKLSRSHAASSTPQSSLLLTGASIWEGEF